MTSYTPPDPVTKRVRFFDGQYLQDQDFIDEQNYHLDRERRTLRGLGVPGVLDGLEVTTTASYEMTISPGTAIDSLGRALVTGEPLVLTFPAALSGSFLLVLVYREVATDIAATGGQSATRWDESPMAGATLPDGSAVVAPADAPVTWTGPVVELGTWTWSGSEFVAVGQAAPLVGLQVPGALGAATLAVGTAARTGLAVDAQGQVAIGTTAVADAGQVVQVSGYDNAAVTVATAAMSSFVMAHNEGEYGAPAGQIIGTTSGRPLSLVTNSAARLTVTETGMVGVGTTTPENAETWNNVLDVYAYDNTKLSVRTSAIDSRVMVHNEGIYGAPPGQIIGTHSTHPVSLVTNSAARLTITSDGHVGIGTTAPENSEGWARVFDVYSSAYTKLSVRTASIDGRVMANNDGTFGAPPGWILGTHSTHPVSLVTNSAARLTITSDGHVGIGTTAPTALLDVEGTLRAASGAVALTVTSDGVNVTRTGGTALALSNSGASIDGTGGAVLNLSPSNASLFGPGGTEVSLSASSANLTGADGTGLALGTTGAALSGTGGSALALAGGSASFSGIVGIGYNAPIAGVPLAIIPVSPTTSTGPNSVTTTGPARGIVVQGRGDALMGGAQAWIDLIATPDSAPSGATYLGVQPCIRLWNQGHAGAAFGYRLEARPAALCLLGTDLADQATFANLHVNNLQATNLPQSSDARLKTGITELASATGTVAQLRGVRFAWTDEALRGAVGGAEAGPHIGVLAQDVAAVLPELVYTDAEGLMSVDYGKLTAVLIQAVKELNGRLAAIETKG